MGTILRRSNNPIKSVLHSIPPSSGDVLPYVVEYRCSVVNGKLLFHRNIEQTVVPDLLNCCLTNK